MSENEIRVLYVQPGKYPEERTIPNTYEARQELVGETLDTRHPWRDSACIICNDSAQDLACRQTVFMGMMAALPGLSLFVGIVMTALSV